MEASNRKDVFRKRGPGVDPDVAEPPRKKARLLRRGIAIGPMGDVSRKRAQQGNLGDIPIDRKKAKRGNTDARDKTQPVVSPDITLQSNTMMHLGSYEAKLDSLESASITGVRLSLYSNEEIMNMAGNITALEMAT